MGGAELTQPTLGFGAPAGAAAGILAGASANAATSAALTAGFKAIREDLISGGVKGVEFIQDASNDVSEFVQRKTDDVNEFFQSTAEKTSKAIDSLTKNLRDSSGDFCLLNCD